MIAEGVYNLFSYCVNDPVNCVDANGRWYQSIAVYRRRYPNRWKQLHNRLKYNDNLFVRIHGSYYNHNYKYIYNQALGTFQGSMQLGSYKLNYNGCEVIAVYNLMLMLGENKRLPSIILEMEMNNMFLYGSSSFMFGTDPYRLGEYFNAHRIKYKYSYNMRQFCEKNYEYGIISFWNKSVVDDPLTFYGDGLHTVAYKYIKRNKTYRVYNYSNYDGYKLRDTYKVFTEIEFFNMLRKNSFICAYQFNSRGR